MIPPSLAVSAATSAFGLVSQLFSKSTTKSVASNATATNGSNASSVISQLLAKSTTKSVASNATTGTSGTSGSSGTGSASGTGSTSGGAISAGSGNSVGSKENDIANQADFMKLLIAQLANQDPLNPLDSANFSAQLAQFSSLQQLTQINDKLGKQADSQNGRFDAVNFIGREVTGPSHAVEVKGGAATTLDYTLATGGTLVMKVVNARGELVANLSLGQEDAGTHTLDLTKVPNMPHLDDGLYAVVVGQADAASGTVKDVTTSITGTVTGVDLTGATPALMLGGRPLALTDVSQINQASSTGSTSN